MILMTECLVTAAKTGWYATPDELVTEAIYLYHWFNIDMGRRKPLKRRCYAWSNARRDFNKTAEEEEADMTALLNRPLKELLLGG